jgi:hypothetical protein
MLLRRDDGMMRLGKKLGNGSANDVICVHGQDALEMLKPCHGCTKLPQGLLLNFKQISLHQATCEIVAAIVLLALKRQIGWMSLPACGGAAETLHRTANIESWNEGRFGCAYVDSDAVAYTPSSGLHCSIKAAMLPLWHLGRKAASLET